MANRTRGAESDLDRMIKELEKLIGTDWKRLAREFNFTPTDIDAIEFKDPRNLYEHIHQCFSKWKMQEGNNATVKKLRDALTEAGLQHILMDLDRALAGHQNAAVQESGLPLAQTSPSQSQSEMVRQKRLQRLLSGNSDGFTASNVSSERQASRSSSTDSSNLAGLEEVDLGRSHLMSPQEKDFKKGSHHQNVEKEFEVGDTVKKVSLDPFPWYGVIKWIGQLPDVPERTAGIEMEHQVKGGHSGCFGGKQYFTCDDGHGLFLPLSSLSRDDRFIDTPSVIQGAIPEEDAVEKDQHLLPQLKASIAAVKLADLPSLGSQASPSTAETAALIFQCPGDQTGFIIGKNGKNIREVESETQTKIQVHHSQTPYGNATVEIIGTIENRRKAFIMICRHVQRRIAQHTAMSETVIIPNRRLCGLVIGKEGTTKKMIETITGANIKIQKKGVLDEVLEFTGPRKCTITGSPEDIESAKELIQRAQEGADIVQAAQIAAYAIKLMEKLKKIGFEFPPDEL